MLSIRGVYENGKITLQSTGGGVPEYAKVLLTFIPVKKQAVPVDSQLQIDDLSEAYYNTLRAYERVRAHGKITIIDNLDRITFPLFDYSKGGLSFIVQQPLEIGRRISAAISDPSDPELVLMELAMEVRGVFQGEKQDEYKVGCMFVDSMDEELWHGVLQFLS